MTRSRLLRVLLIVLVASPVAAGAQPKGPPARRPPPPAPAGTAVVTPPAKPAGKPKLAVFEVRPLGAEAAKAELVSEIALTEASSLRGFEVIGKSDVVAMIGFEKQKAILGCSEDSACLAELGGALGVDLVMIGSLGRLGTLYRLDVKLVDVRRSRIRGRVGVNVEGQEERLVAATQRAVRALLEPDAVPSLAAAPPAPAPAPIDLSAPPPAPPRSSRALGWTAFGAGLASVGLGAFAAYEGLTARSRYATGKGMLEGGALKVDASAGAFDRAISDGDASKRLAYVGAGAAVGCAVLSGVLGYVSYRRTGEIGPLRF